jgi:hypothetical protein
MARKLRATQVGAEQLAADRARVQTGLGRVIEDWTQHDIHRLAEALTQFNTSVERLQGRAWPRPAHNDAANDERS